MRFYFNFVGKNNHVKSLPLLRKRSTTKIEIPGEGVGVGENGHRIRSFRPRITLDQTFALIFQTLFAPR